MSDKYDLFMIDPPWDKKKGGKRKVRPDQGKQLDYNVMGTGKVFELLDKEIFSKAADQHTVFMWTIDEFMRVTEEYMENRGYKRHARLIWDKTNGVAPAFTIRYTHEYLIWYYKPKLMEIAEKWRGHFTTVMREPARQHSRKPEIAYQMIDAMYPNAKKYDVFSRTERAGWDRFGDQTDLFEDDRVAWLFGEPDLPKPEEKP